MPLLPRSEQESTPICRCRVLYLGSAVPHATKDGLQGIQEPLRELYPEQGALGARGIDSWLSVWSNGLLLENVDENHKKVTRFFPIDTLHYCAAIRYVLVPEKSSVSTTTQPRFLPLDSPFARSPNPNHPPLFAAILRRTSGIKVLECHAFICKREVAANALVRCCFHAYADNSYVKQIGGNVNGINGSNDGNGSLYGTLSNGGGQHQQSPSSSNNLEKIDVWRRLGARQATTGSTLTLNSTLHASSTPQENGMSANLELSNSADDVSIYNGDENHKVWAGSTRDLSADKEALYGEYSNGGDSSTVRRRRSHRPRQIMNAPPPPPPPPPTSKDEKTLKKSHKERTRRKKLSEGSRDDMYYLSTNGSTLMRPTYAMMNGGAGLKSSSSISGGTIMRGYPKAYPSLNGIYANGATLRPAASYMNGFHPIHGAPPPPPPLMMVPTILPYPPRRISTGSSARPMSPVASYQPAHFPHEAYLMHQQFATVDMKTAKKKKHRSKKNSLGSGMPLPSTMSMSIPNGKPASRIVNGDGGGDDEELDLDSMYHTGPYKRSGHMNERAFSYSIRQEHRSRSYGSLANLKFAPPPVLVNGNIPTIDPSVNKEELKKEREIMQMMQDLELSGDELERSEVPVNVYQHQNKIKSTKIRR